MIFGRHDIATSTNLQSISQYRVINMNPRHCGALTPHPTKPPWSRLDMFGYQSQCRLGLVYSNYSDWDRHVTTAL